MPRGSDRRYHREEFGIGGGTYFIDLLAGFKAVIDDKGVEQVGPHCDDPISVDAEVRDWVDF